MKWIDNGLREMRDFRRKPLSHRIEPCEEKASPREKPTSQKEVKPATQQQAKKPEQKKSSEKLLLYDTPIDRGNLTDEQYDYIQNLRKALSDPKAIKHRDVNALIKEIGLTKEEQQLIESEMRTLEKSPPTVEGSHDDYVVIERLERLIRDDPTLGDTYDAWWKSVEQAVGKVNSRSQLTPEQWKKIPPPPPKLEEMIRYIMPKK